jgi:hypothetical protein
MGTTIESIGLSFSAGSLSIFLTQLDHFSDYIQLSNYYFFQSYQTFKN